MLTPRVRLTPRSRLLLDLACVAGYLSALGTFVASAQVPTSLWLVLLITSASIVLAVLLKKRSRYAGLVANIKLIDASKPLDRLPPTRIGAFPDASDVREEDGPVQYL